MSEELFHLHYKTRGDSSPQGKQKVYFCCHPKDFDRFFEKISDEILYEPGNQNCAVCYAKDIHAPRDGDFLDELKQMNLFVMPVTTELLVTPNHAIETEFPFAMENHIPVLPLMQEGGLEDLFNKKCGDLQFLDPHKEDITAIPYEEKFKKYLSSALIGDELAEKIRDAFDAYVFLSYRKKDRKHARKLMRLIHQNDFCRDIAIWYDEFLIPGENFNEAIGKALKKSNLFVLVVTPNLVNEKNYVMTKEYPMARDAKEKKPIVPAEMVETDRDELTAKYEGIPTPTNAHDDAALTAALRAAVEGLVLRQNDSPRHNFFIGLAYLGGIDVEVDHPRAVTLITSAAEAGLVEAVDKLIDMYENGEGVERNYHTAVAWREKKIALQKKAYREAPDGDLLDALFGTIIHCGDAYRALGNSSSAREMYTTGEKLVEDSSRKEKKPTILRNLSICYIRLGGLCEFPGDLDGAQAYYEKAFDVSKQLIKKIDTAEARRALSVSYERLGNVCMANGDNDKAKRYYEESLAIREQLVNEFDTIQARRDLSVSYIKLGYVCQALHEAVEAKMYYERSLAIFEQLVKETDTIKARRDLSVCCIKLGDICVFDDHVKAKMYYERAHAIREQLVKETGTVESRRDLSVSYERLGDIYDTTGDYVMLRECYEKSLAISEQLANEINTAKYIDDLGVSCFKLAMIFPKHSEEYNAYLQKVLDIFEKLSQKYPKVARYRENLDEARSALQ